MSKLMFSSIFAGIVVLVLSCDLCLSEELKGEESYTSTSIMAWEGKRSLPTDASEMARNLDAVREAFVEKPDHFIEETRRRQLDPNTLDRLAGKTTLSTPEIGDMLRKHINSFPSKGRKDTWFSKNPNDLEPLLGSKLDIYYYLDGMVEKVLIFTTDWDTHDDGTVFAGCKDQYDTVGLVYYTDFPFGGHAYWVALQGQTPHPAFGKIVDIWFDFKICHSRDECDLILGIVTFLDADTDETIHWVELSPQSRCLDGCKNAYCNGDVDGDGKIGLQEAIKALKVTSGTP